MTIGSLPRLVCTQALTQPTRIRCGVMMHQAWATIRLRAGGQYSRAVLTASPAPAAAASPMRPKLAAMKPARPAMVARIPSSQRQFQQDSSGPGRRIYRTADSRLDITLGSFGRRGRPDAITLLRPRASRARRPSRPLGARSWAGP